ncbi:unnamed protein product [Nezara viridula]|uniref:Uncharacterized protein n=1 Tax=Nezara viridula TaxID=85310 RepID=A0A9P0HT31_NEZVI|nr:unnamed protein product [Nezara viridula]
MKSSERKNAANYFTMVYYFQTIIHLK